MKRMALTLLATVLLACGCTEREDAEAEARRAEEAALAAAAATNRVQIPSAVRENLGITFVQVERRRVEQTLRVPGRFELLPTARREYRTMLPGRVELLVEQFERVEAGHALYRIDSPGWRELQQQLTEVEASILRLGAKAETFEPIMAAHMEHEQGLEASVSIWEERVRQLEAVREAGGGRASELAEAQTALSSARSELGGVREKDAELRAAKAETAADLDAARARRRFLLGSASALVGLPAAELEAVVADGGERLPRWATIGAIVVRAEEAGVVESLGLTNGSWADEKVAVVTTVQPERVRFHAEGLQSDLGHLRDGLASRIVPPAPTRAEGSIDLTETMSGELQLGIIGDPNDRTVALYVTPDSLVPWAQPGISAQLEIVTDSTAQEELAIPLAAVQRDGLTPVVFRRDPSNANEVIRLEADLGVSDGRWVSVRSGVAEGDEIVLDGAFQLMLATSGSMQKGGHFHADGTFHEGED